MAGLSEADGFLEDTILAPCGERVDKALLSELKFNQFQVRGSFFEPFQPVCSLFCPGRGVRPLAAVTRQKDPRTTSQLDVSLPMSGAPRSRPIAVVTPSGSSETNGSPRRVSPDDPSREAPRDGCLGKRLKRALGGRVSPDEGGRVSREKSACLSTQTSRRQAHGS
jgi:hypothetical protein